MRALIYAVSMPDISPLLIGHRGAPGYLPEHTRSSYELAISMGVDAVEPDVVATADGVLVVRHENEISGTTDVAERPEFADRRTTKTFLGHEMTGWFTEDFTWAELQTLRCRERLPQIRRASAAHDGEEPMLSLRELLDLCAQRGVGIVLEVKHPTYFASIGVDLAALVAGELREAGWASGEHPLVIECFEKSVLGALQALGVRAQYIYLLEAAGAPLDLLATLGAGAPRYADSLTPAGLDALVGEVGGISVDKQMLLASGNTIVADAHARGLAVFTWTCRPENAFLDAAYRTGDDPAVFGNWQEEWATIAATGIDGVFVDHADLGAQIFRHAR